MIASGAHSLPKACGAAALRLGANLLAPNFTKQPTEISVKESIESKSSGCLDIFQKFKQKMVAEMVIFSGGGVREVCA